ncbi:glycine-rich cell wall structural protein 1.8 isoform X2 [Chelonus insularis]|uniref:glycine-rich cell wall structural protein 1.8 isoform X2 n=1 Tax=Chelonus insularis TaxID=460826 RepID=UPI00158F5BF8|nr:glycine-rich cell wall structural protein 1.8 isoform X2 [Chelonus insularis]
MVSSTMPRKTKIFVGRLPENCRNDELRQLFLRFGEVTECDVMNRYGFVHMAREEDAAAAIKALHNTHFKGATINVEQSTGKSRGGGAGGRRDDRRSGPMRGGRGNRDNNRDNRPGPYNHRGVRPIPHVGYGGSTTNNMSGGYSDYGNRGGNDFGGRGNDYSSGGYADRNNYGQNIGVGSMGGYSSTAPPMTGYGSNTGPMGGYGPVGGGDYGRNNDYNRMGDFGARSDYGNFQSNTGMGGDFNRGMPNTGDYGRDNFGMNRNADPYSSRNDYDRNAVGPMRNGGAVGSAGYGSGYTDIGPMGGGPNYSTGMASYNSTSGAQSDVFSRRSGNTAANTAYPSVGSGYGDGYDRPDTYGLSRGNNRWQPG